MLVSQTRRMISSQDRWGCTGGKRLAWEPEAARAVLLIDGTCHASHAGEYLRIGGVLGVSKVEIRMVVHRIARADRDQKLSFCCAQSEAAHPYLAAVGLTPSDVLLSPVHVQEFWYSASFSASLCSPASGTRPAAPLPPHRLPPPFEASCIDFPPPFLAFPLPSSPYSTVPSALLRVAWDLPLPYPVNYKPLRPSPPHHLF
ncbi:unnamed protein product [Closterium sp. Naga37s-1]|nr:unnamed protein product [Closterium sp. Naga37s-1]